MRRRNVMPRNEIARRARELLRRNEQNVTLSKVEVVGGYK
jgi:hypothetical protein